MLAARPRFVLISGAMARWEYRLPDIGEGVAEGEIVTWLVRPGDSVREDQPIIELMTDKATVTITAPRAGVVVETHGRVGEVVAVHSVLVVFELGELGPESPGGHPPSVASAPSATPHTNGHHAPVAHAAHANAGAPDVLSRPPVGEPSDQRLATPATRRYARELDVDLRSVPATGPLGRVTRSDVDAYARVRAPEPKPAGAPTSPEVAAPVSPPSPAARRAGPAAPSPVEERVPFVGMRRKIAQKMSQSKTTAAHFTFVEECDASELKALRARLLEPAKAQGVKLSFLPFIVRAVVASLRKHPVLASTLDEATGELVLRRSFGIGIATATPAGLMVPVVKDADRRNLVEIAREIDRVSGDARAGTSKLEDLQGSTFTITSLGAQSGLLATPIINFPEVAILGVHRIKERPVVKAGQIVIGDVMTLSLSFDHRIVDGHVGAAFAYEVIGYLEHPERLLLE
jgi:pyruvate dehydrogenase E2 component (dihydrolipoamide acetyltransferase)